MTTENHQPFMSPRFGLALLLICGALALLWYEFWGSARTAKPPREIAQDEDWYAARDWQEGRESSLNISVFVFRDRNRNGVYDVGDLPMASTVVTLEKPNGSTTYKRSNINGYTNFGMRFGDDNADIGLADKPYSFELQVPPGWAVTTANQRQSTEFNHLPGSVSGLVAKSPPAVIGMAPDLIVRGTLLSSGSGQLLATAQGPEGKVLEIAPDQQGAFSFRAVPGEWRLQLTDQVNGHAVIRKFHVHDAPVQLAAVDVLEDLPEPLHQEVLQDFDYLDRSFIDKIPSGNLGLGWDYLLAVDNQTYGGPGYVNILSSGHAVGYNSSGHPVTISSIGPGESFDFVGAYFGTAWRQAEGETLVVEAWRGAQRIGREEVALSYLGPVWFQADYRAIDRLTIATEHYWQFVTDDMQFRVDTAGASGDVGNY